MALDAKTKRRNLKYKKARIFFLWTSDIRFKPGMKLVLELVESHVWVSEILQREARNNHMIRKKLSEVWQLARV